jgi:hypothetical protein
MSGHPSMSTDTSEKGLESLIIRHMTGTDGLAIAPGARSPSRPRPTAAPATSPAARKDYDRAHALDVAQLFAFLRATQPEAVKKLAMADAHDAKDINRLKFLTRLSAEIGKRGVIDVLRKGIEHHPAAALRPVLRHAVGGQRQGPRRCTRRTASRSPASSPTAPTRRGARSTWACSSTACRSPPSS